MLIRIEVVHLWLRVLGCLSKNVITGIISVLGFCFFGRCVQRQWVAFARNPFNSCQACGGRKPLR